MMPIYEPQEDSWLLAKFVKQHSRGSVLDIGCGSGVQIESALKSKRTKKITGIDIDANAVNFCKKKFLKAVILKSDLFSELKNKVFDTIVCNPPYLPNEPADKFPALYGGKHGYEYTCRLLNECGEHLTKNGALLLFSSSITNQRKILECAMKNLFNVEILVKEKQFFEEFFVYKITKTVLRNNIEMCRIKKNRIRNLHFFAKGAHGIIFTGKCKNNIVIIKAKNPESTSIKSIFNEAKILKLVNKKRIGPKLLNANKQFVVMQKVKGTLLPEYLETAMKPAILKSLKDIFNQCFALDKIHICKEEMHRPLKHAFVQKNNKVILIDFDRAHKTKNPHNVTQFAQFILSRRDVLEKKGVFIDKKQVIHICKKYKIKLLKETFEQLKKQIFHHI